MAGRLEKCARSATKRVAVVVLLLAVVGVAGCGDDESTPPAVVATGTYTLESGTLHGDVAKDILQFLGDGGLDEYGLDAHRKWEYVQLIDRGIAELAAEPDKGGASVAVGAAPSRDPTPLEFRVRLRLVVDAEGGFLYREMEFPAVECSYRDALRVAWASGDVVQVRDRSDSSPTRCPMSAGGIEVPFLGRMFRLSWQSASTTGAKPVALGADK